MEEEEIKSAVSDAYSKVTKREISIPLNPLKCCCTKGDLSHDISRAVGYNEQELASVPEGANLGLGCGNPTALASLKEGETVLDLGDDAHLHLCSDWVPLYVNPADADLPGIWREYAREHSDGRRLTGTVWAKKPEQFTFGNSERDVVHSGDSAESLC
jgi:hypothetical protein